MRQSQKATFLSISLLVFALAHIAAQFISPKVSYGGGWCKPSLDAPTDQGFYTYQFKGYGFPIPGVIVAKEECFSEPIITYEWFLPGVLVDGALLVIILYLWFHRNQIFQQRNETGVQEI